MLSIPQRKIPPAPTRRPVLNDCPPRKIARHFGLSFQDVKSLGEGLVLLEASSAPASALVGSSQIGRADFRRLAILAAPDVDMLTQGMMTIAQQWRHGRPQGDDHTTSAYVRLAGFSAAENTSQIIAQVLRWVGDGSEEWRHLVPAALTSIRARIQHLPLAEDTLRTAEALLAGHALSAEDIEDMDAALRQPVIRRICADRNLEVEFLAAAVGRIHPSLNTEDMLSAWAQACFGEKRALNGVLPAPLEHPGVLHKAIRRLTHDGHCGLPGQDLPSGAHQSFSGACAAFAVVLNRVLQGRGRYVTSEDPAKTTGCSHIALRVGDFVCDGAGVHTPQAFGAKWCAFGQPYELLDTTPNGQIIRGYAAKHHGLDEAALERDLRTALAEGARRQAA